MVGIMTANFTNAPNATLIYESGICDGKTMHVPMSVCDQRAANIRLPFDGLVDTFGYYLQQGYVTLGFLGGAAIDKYGGVNVTSVGDYYKPTHRFTGSGGTPTLGRWPTEQLTSSSRKKEDSRTERIYNHPRVVVLGL